MKIRLSLCLAAVLPLSSLFAFQSSSSMLDVSYDRFDDITRISTVASRVANPVGPRQEKHDLRLQFAYECTGDTTHCRPGNVEFRFLSQSVGEYTGSDQLTLIAGGKRIRRTVKWAGEYERTVLVEHITASMNLEEFLDVANAESIEARLGATTFRLSEDNFAAIRLLAGEIGATANE